MWLRLAMTLSGEANREERLAALDRSIGLDQDCFQAHDLKAQILAEAGRWDEALAACHPPVYGEQPPIYLRGRAAWIGAQRGDFSTAMTEMRAILSEDGDYYWGWQNLAEWSCNHGSAKEYLEAAEAMVRVVPKNVTAAAYRGEARLKTGDREGARAEFQRALDETPDYGFAAASLFDLDLEDRDIDAAATSLGLLKTHHPGPLVDAREIQLAMARKDLATAESAPGSVVPSAGGKLVVAAGNGRQGVRRRRLFQEGRAHPQESAQRSAVRSGSGPILGRAPPVPSTPGGSSGRSAG